jgi:signal transduction histidine kinase
MLLIATLSSTSMLLETRSLTFGVYAIGLGVLTWVMIPSQPRNGAVWALAWTSIFAALLAAGVAMTVLWALNVYPNFTYDELRELSPSELPLLAAIGVQFLGWTIVPAFWLPLTLGLLLFPDGHPPSPRWKWVGWWSVGAITVAAVATALLQNPSSDLPIKAFEGEIEGSTISLVASLAFALATISAVVSIASLVVRYRRSSGATRSQIRWIAWGGSIYVASFLIGPAIEPSGQPAPGWQLVLLGVQAVLLVSYGIAITRYRLYDIDIVISKTVTYGVLIVFITAVYALVVVGIGGIVRGGDEPGLALSIAAVAIVAVVFEPLRNRVQGWANRIVFGNRASPYEVLSQTTARLAGANSPDDALAQVTQLVVDGTGASEAVLWLKVGGTLQPNAATPVTALDGLSAVPISGDDLAGLPGQTSTTVRHRGEMLGALSIEKLPGEPVTVVDEKTLRDVASGTGLLLRNIGLNAELVRRAEQLRVSRRRLVASHDTERHRLERDLHDGAQQQVVAIKVKLGIARTLAEREGAAEVEAFVSSLSETTQQAVDEMRAVAHGIYPPLLESEGLGVALTSASRTTSIPFDLEVETDHRYPRSVEETIYFCILETVARAIDGGASWVRVALAESPNTVRYTVHHDGTITTLLAVEDRVEAFGGQVALNSGTAEAAVIGELPIVEVMATTS